MENTDVNGQDDLNNEKTVNLSQQEYDKLLKKSNALDSSTKEAQKLQWVDKIRSNPKEFVKLYDSDKRIAGEVAEHFNSISWDSYTVEDYYKMQNQVSDNSTEDIDSKVEKLLNKREATKVYHDFETKNGIWDDEFWKEFKDLYQDLIEWKVQNAENVNKYAQIAIRELKQTSKHLQWYKETMDQVEQISWIWTSWRAVDNQSNKGWYIEALKAQHDWRQTYKRK